MSVSLKLNLVRAGLTFDLPLEIRTNEILDPPTLVIVTSLYAAAPLLLKGPALWRTLKKRVGRAVEAAREAGGMDGGAGEQGSKGSARGAEHHNNHRSNPQDGDVVQDNDVMVRNYWAGLTGFGDVMGLGLLSRTRKRAIRCQKAVVRFVEVVVGGV